MDLLPARLVAELHALPVLADAACRDLPGMWDDLLDGEDPDARDARVRLAIKVCRTCPARRACARLATTYGPSEISGVWAARLRGRDHVEERRPATA